MKRAIFLCVICNLIFGEPACGQLFSNTSTAVAPPPGNSPGTVVKTTSAYKVYICSNGVWTCAKVYARLLNPKTNAVVGNYTAAFNNTGEFGTWALINSIGDQVESGASASLVTGIPAPTSYVENSTISSAKLYQAASHQNDGAAASVSYIQMYNAVGGLPPPPEKCSSSRSYGVTVPFSAEYCLWTQDQVPPSVPDRLVAPGRAVEGLFAEGYIEYNYNGSEWEVSARNGTLYNLPGTPAIGSYWMKDGLEGWQLSDPNGFVLQGNQIPTEVAVAKDSCPWSLSKVSSQSTSSSAFGSIDHVQMISTRGGTPPPPSVTLLRLSNACKVPFTAIFWFYASS